jgi:hypothetical protein
MADIISIRADRHRPVHARPRSSAAYAISDSSRIVQPG